MARIRVITTVEITDNLDRPIVTLTKTADADPGYNPRFFATFTRGACQANEHALNNMLIAEYGDHKANTA